jgi:Mycotoxin biosynthesis protein UstYa
LFNEDDILLRNEPSPEVDDAWKALTDIGVVIINGEEVSKLGKDPKKTVKAPPSWGYGDDAHLTQPDGQHALHCLNALADTLTGRNIFQPKQLVLRTPLPE